MSPNLCRIDAVNDVVAQREAANHHVLEIFGQARPAVIDIRTARDVIQGMEDDLILHAGPPIAWERMCGPMRGAILGALVYEGRAATLNDAQRLCDSGAIRFEPCHDHDAVAPMAGLITPSPPVLSLGRPLQWNPALSNTHEGPRHNARPRAQFSQA